MKIPITVQQEPEYKEYLKITNKPSWFEYMAFKITYRVDMEIAKRNKAFLKYSKRNVDYLFQINRTETFVWFIKYVAQHRIESVDQEKTIMSIYKFPFLDFHDLITTEFCRDQINKDRIINILDQINLHRQILEN